MKYRNRTLKFINDCNITPWFIFNFTKWHRKQNSRRAENENLKRQIIMLKIIISVLKSKYKL